MDAGRYTFALDIPPDFQRDVLAGHRPRIQLNIDATRMTQAFNGNMVRAGASSPTRSTPSPKGTGWRLRCRSISIFG